jgi:hypothetical protein
MCNLYAHTRKDDDLARFLRVSHNRWTRFEPVNAIFHATLRQWFAMPRTVSGNLS